MTGLSDGESISTISLAVLTQHRSVTDGQTDGDGRNCTVNIARCIDEWTNVETVVVQWRIQGGGGGHAPTPPPSLGPQKFLHAICTVARFTDANPPLYDCFNNSNK